METFYETVRAGTLTGAAKVLRTSQPTVSRTLSALESRLRLPLFDRRKGQVSPTPEGLALYRETEKIYVGLRGLGTYAQAIKRQKEQGLSIACLPALGQSFLPEVLRRFKSCHPDFTASLQVCGPAQALRLMEEGRVDLTVSNQLSTEEGLIKVHMIDAKFVCAVPEGHALANKEIITSVDIENETLIGMEAEPGLDWIPHEDLYSSMKVRPKIDFFVKRSAIAYALVAKGLGIAILEPFSALSWQVHGVVTRPFQPVVNYHFNIYFPREKIRSSYCDAFVEELVQYAKGPAIPHQG